jgi:hypothetical protein
VKLQFGCGGTRHIAPHQASGSFNDVARRVQRRALAGSSRCVGTGPRGPAPRRRRGCGSAKVARAARTSSVTRRMQAASYNGAGLTSLVAWISVVLMEPGLRRLTRGNLTLVRSRATCPRAHGALDRYNGAPRLVSHG